MAGRVKQEADNFSVTAYMRATGKDPLAIEDFERQTRSEATNLMAMGLPVLVSLVFLFSLFVIFAFF